VDPAPPKYAGQAGVLRQAGLPIETIVSTEAQNSVEITANAKGETSWKVKADFRRGLLKYEAMLA